MIWLVAIAWIYVVLLMAVAEAMSSNGTVAGAVFTVLLYGALPLSIVLYVLNAPARRKRRQQREMESSLPQSSSADPNGSGHASADAVASEREKP